MTHIAAYEMASFWNAEHMVQLRVEDGQLTREGLPLFPTEEKAVRSFARESGTQGHCERCPVMCRVWTMESGATRFLVPMDRF